MPEKLKALFRKYREILLYLLFGVLTTAVNWIVYFPLTNLFSVHYQAANAAGWIAAVLFAFFTNKIWVFRKKDFSGGVFARELLSFTGARVFSLFAEMALMYLTVERMGVPENVAKLVAAVVVVILNYVLSKWIVFASGKIDWVMWD